MIIGLEGFGSVWSTRVASALERAAFYNTTGIVADGKLKHRSRVFGQVRFNALGGFNPKCIERNVGRIFKTAGPVAPGCCSLLLHHLLSRPEPPDYFLFSVTSDRTGALQSERSGWKSDGVMLISMSQLGDQQEAMLLMPVLSWIRGSLGRFVVDPCAQRSWRASLQLMG